MKRTLDEIIREPVFFERNRVYRVYRGGKLFHDLFGDEPRDGHYPEEWIASDVRALNERENGGEREGISRIENSDYYLDEILAQAKEEMLGRRKRYGLLLKALDSAVRLPVQAHPDREFSRRHFCSDYGKTESWIILAVRENAKLYYGFKEKTDKDMLRKAVRDAEEDRDALAKLLNCIPVHTGEVYFVPRKMVHAIGEGCLILEVQEATDFTIQPDVWCGEHRLSEYEKYLGVAPEEALDCFDYALYGEEAVKAGKKEPILYQNRNGIRSEHLITEADTSCFLVNRHYLADKAVLAAAGPAVYMVLNGSAVLRMGDFQRKIKKGDYFMIPFCISRKCRIMGKGGLELIECIPPAE